MQDAIRDIRRIYDPGVPFFSKDALRHMAHLLEAVKNGRKQVFVMGLDGKPLKFVADAETVTPNKGPFDDVAENVGIELM